MPRLAQAPTSSRATSTPRRCPAMRGLPRRRAQRPLPSMTTAMCRGMASGNAFNLRSESLAGRRRRASYFHDFAFLLRHDGVDFGDELVGQFLDALAGALFVVLGDLLFL